MSLKTSNLLILAMCFLISSIFLPPVFGISLKELYVEPGSKVPNWVKSNAFWWAQDLITDKEFLNGIEYLISEKIILIEAPPSAPIRQGTEVPGWIKTTAGWWADGSIAEDDFLAAIQYLIKKGIIVVKTGFEVTSSAPGTYDVIVGGVKYPVKYDIGNNNELIRIELYPSFSVLIIDVKTTVDDYLTIEIPRNLIDARFKSFDDEFFVLTNGVEIDFDEIRGDFTRTLSFNLLEGDEEIEIIGTHTAVQYKK